MSKTTLVIDETFQQTVQGEGHWVGMPCDFIRLAGCPVGCHFCDTGYANGHQVLGSNERIEKIIGELKSTNVVISGGEPFIHKRLPDLVSALLNDNRRVFVETSGSFWQDIDGRAWVTLSPKEHINPKYPVDERFWDRADEIKIVISSGDELDFYNSKILNLQVYLQPEWTNRDRTIPLILEMLKKHPTCRLSLQTHKIIGVQ
jgi:organic radical activating enzyme